MIRILFLILCIFPVLGPQARGAIEIYVHGHKYDSLQAYAASKKSVHAGAIHESPLRKELSDAALHQLYVMSVEKGVIEAIAQTLAASHDPKLLISTSGKLRIMALTADDHTK